LFGRAQYKLPEAADWLLRVLNTKTANGLLVAAIWGLTLEDEIQVSPNSRLVPFSSLRKSSVKERIEQRARRRGDNAVWLTPTFFDKPGTAFITEVRDLPYISADGSPFEILESVTRDASEVWSLVQAISVGRLKNQHVACRWWLRIAKNGHVGTAKIPAEKHGGRIAACRVFHPNGRRSQDMAGIVKGSCHAWGDLEHASVSCALESSD
jgi:hypothetical protein